VRQNQNLHIDLIDLPPALSNFILLSVFYKITPDI